MVSKDKQGKIPRPQKKMPILLRDASETGRMKVRKP